MKRVKTRQAARSSKASKTLDKTATESIGLKVDQPAGQDAGEPQTCSPTTLADAHNNAISSEFMPNFEFHGSCSHRRGMKLVVLPGLCTHPPA
jgi:hypothetical protein